MNKMMCTLMIVPLLTLIAQEVIVDEVVLKDGRTVRGKLLDFTPGGSGRLRISEDSVFVFDASDMAKLNRVQEGSPSAEEQRKPRFGVWGGMAFPLGTFGEASAKETAGFAKAGFAFGIAVDLPLESSATASVEISYLTNPMNGEEYARLLGVPSSSMETTQWSSLNILGGIKTGERAYFGLMLGAAFAHSPEITMTLSPSASIKVSSASSTALSVLLTGGYVTPAGLYVFVRLSHTKPTFEATMTAPGMTATAKGIQSMQTLTAGLGVRF